MLSPRELIIYIYILYQPCYQHRTRPYYYDTRSLSGSFEYYNVCSFIPILWVIFFFRVTVYVIKWSNKRMRLARAHRTTTTAAAAYRYPCFLNYRLLLCVYVCTRHGLLTLDLLKCRSIGFGTGFTIALVSFNCMWNSINQKFSEFETYFPEYISFSGLRIRSITRV